MNETLHDRLQRHRFACRLERAKMIRDWPEGDERRKEAETMLREIALRRVWDRFTDDQEMELVQVLHAIAYPVEEGSEGQKKLF